MADTELANLSEDTTPDPTDWIYGVDSGGTTDKKYQSEILVRSMLPAYPPESTFAYGIPNGIASKVQQPTSLLATNRTWYYFFPIHKAVTITEIFAAVANSPGSGTVYVGVVELDPTTRQPKSTGLKGQTSFSSSSTGSKNVTSLSWSLPIGLYATVVTPSVATVDLRAWCFNLPGLAQGQAISTNMNDIHSNRTNFTGGGGAAFSDPVSNWNTTSNGAEIGDTGWIHPILFKWT